MYTKRRHKKIHLFFSNDLEREDRTNVTVVGTGKLISTLGVVWAECYFISCLLLLLRCSPKTLNESKNFQTQRSVGLKSPMKVRQGILILYREQPISCGRSHVDSGRMAEPLKA